MPMKVLFGWSTPPADLLLDVAKRTVDISSTASTTKLKIAKLSDTASTAYITQDEAIGIFTSDGMNRIDGGGDYTDTAADTAYSKVYIEPVDGSTGLVRYNDEVNLVVVVGGVRRLVDVGLDGGSMLKDAGANTWGTTMLLRSAS